MRSNVARFMQRTRAQTHEETPMNMRFSFRFAAPLALAVSLATLAPAFAAGDNNSDQPVTDTWITTKVKSELATTDGVKSMDVDVKTVNGSVTLTGMLATETAVEKAVAAAKSVKGVKDVDASGLKAGAKP
jgi:hyperosmotically inducible protein